MREYSTVCALGCVQSPSPSLAPSYIDAFLCKATLNCKGSLPFLHEWVLVSLSGWRLHARIAILLSRIAQVGDKPWLGCLAQWRRSDDCWEASSRESSERVQIATVPWRIGVNGCKALQGYSRRLPCQDARVPV